MPDTATRYTMRVTANCCGYAGTIAAVELHDCTIQQQGGRCEDYPCCGHTDGDGCQTLPEHTSAYYLDNPHLLHEPGSPEWFDAMDDGADDEDDVMPCGCFAGMCSCDDDGAYEDAYGDGFDR